MADTGFLFEPYLPAPPPGGNVPRSCSLLTAIPPPPLADFVDVFWLWQSDPAARTKERILPTGTTQLIIDLGDVTSAPLICGAQSEFAVVDSPASLTPVSLVGVHFKPGGAFPFLNVPAGELRNDCVSLDALWGSAAGALRDQLFDAETPTAKFRVLERALLARAARPLVRHPAIAHALTQFQRGPHSPTVGEVNERIGLSPRRFIQLFTDEVGLTPKLFCRIRRFQEVLRRVRDSPRVEWLRIALDCGYYDQAHFIRDFRALSGLSPTAYLRAWAEHLNHVPCARSGKENTIPVAPILAE